MERAHSRSISSPEGRLSLAGSNSLPINANRSRAKTLSPATTPELETFTQESSQGSTSTSTGLQILQSIKDLTHQELYRANPLGLLGKEVISVTGTTHCPEPVPPQETLSRSATINSTSSSITPSKLSPIEENEPQQIRFPLTHEEILQMQQQSTMPMPVLVPYPADVIPSDGDDPGQPYLFSQPSPNTLMADFIPPTMTINVFEVFIYAWGVAAFFFDMVTDLVLAQAYYMEGAYWLFLLTLMCVLVPNLTLSLFSLVWYIDQSQLKSKMTTPSLSSNVESTFVENSAEKEPTTLHRTRRQHFQFSAATANVITWIIRIVILVLQLDLCLKYIRGLYYTWKGFQKRHDPKWQRFYLTKQILIDADIALLRVFDCFMDSGSQVTLQLYIMLRLGSASMKFDTLFLKQCLSIVSSLGSLAYALSGYSRCWRHMQLTHSPQGWPKDKPAPQLVSWWSTIIQWIWYLFLITPRVLALAMFAATFRSWFWIIMAAHWWGMLFWILRFKTIFCISDQTQYNPREAIFEKCYNLVCSYIFIFCYMNLRQGDTRIHYIAFYTIYYIENLAFAVIYAIHSAETNVFFKYSLVIFVCLGFWLAIFFQFLYYRFLHPSDQVRLNAKRNVTSLVHIQPLSHLEHLKRSKSCEEMIRHPTLIQNQETQSVGSDRTSLNLEKSIEERWHNRFAKENRQKILLQQRAIDQRVKLTRVQKQWEEASKRQQTSSSGLLSKISTTLKRPTTISTDLVSARSQPSMIPTTVIFNQTSIDSHLRFDSKVNTFPRRSPSQRSDRFVPISEEVNNEMETDQHELPQSTNENPDEMVLTATKLSSTPIDTRVSFC